MWRLERRLMGDSVALRANDWLQEVIPGVQLDAAVSRNLETGLEVYQTDISNKVLLQKCNSCFEALLRFPYYEVLNKLVEKLPKKDTV